MQSVLPASFFQRPVLAVAPDLLGRELCVQHQETLLRVRLTDVEAYDQCERACHAFGGRRTPRNDAMFQPGGIAYVYFVYGMHWVLNFVTGDADYATAVMIRGALPVAGLDTIARLRKLDQLRSPPRDPRRWLQGPARVAQGLGLTGAHNGLVLQSSAGIWLEVGEPIDPQQIVTGPRIGVDYAGADAQLPWRFSTHQKL